MEHAIRSLIGEADVRKGKVTLDLPPLVENGNTVPLTVIVDSPMTKADHVKAIHVFNEKNPQAQCHQRATRPARRKGACIDRVRLAGTQTLTAIAEMSDGTYWSDSQEVIVTLAGLPGGPDMSARALINVPRKAKARASDRDQDADLAHHGDRLPPRHDRRADPARTSSRSFTCKYNGEEIFATQLYPAIAANPFVTFHTGRDGKRHARVPLDRGPTASRRPKRPRLRWSNFLRRHRSRGIAIGAGMAVLGTSLALAEIPLDQRRSGYDQLSSASKAMQDDDTSNPATLTVLDGEALWGRQVGDAGKSCADCHGDAATSDARRVGALSGVQPGESASDRHRTARQSLPHRAAEGGRRSRTKPRSARSDGVLRQASRAACRSRL
jgi:sulfur-oxidizing protein SoxY